MSNTGANGDAPEREALTTLEGAVGKMIDRLAEMERRIQAAESRSSELGEVVKRFTGDEADGGRILSRLKKLEEENGVLRSRLEEGREGVDRLIAKIRFLESQE